MAPVPLLVPFLLAAAAPEAPPGLGAFSWCVAEGQEASGPVRYFSDPFETDRDEGDAQVFGEYVAQAYLHRRDSGYAVRCTHFPSRAAAAAALGKARADRAGARIVTTAWRARFE